MKTAALFRFVFALAAAAAAMPAFAGADEDVGFAFDNREVNEAILSLYESNPGIWQPGQLFFVGMCYVAEKRYDEAQALFENLRDQGHFRTRLLRTLGTIHDEKKEYDEASRLYRQAWDEIRDLPSLLQLAAVKLETKDLAGFEELLGDLLEHQTEDLGIQKFLLGYSLVTDDREAGWRVFDNVVRHLRKEDVEEPSNDDLRNLLRAGAYRFKDAARAKMSAENAPEEAPDKGPGALEEQRPSLRLSLPTPLKVESTVPIRVQ